MSGESQRKVFKVSFAATGQRLDRWVAERLSDYSRSAVQRLIRNGCVRINGRLQTKCGAFIHDGDTVEVEIPPPASAILLAQPIALDILFEDNALLVLNKPPGMVVHPAAGNREGTLVNALLHHCRGLSTIGGVERPGIIHRLDKLTSGLLVVAKSDAAHRHLAAQLANRTMKRTYLAVVWGQPQPPAGTIEAAIGRHPRDRKRMAVRKEGGRRAVTHYRTLAAAGGLAVLELSLETGRTHQIRVHLSHLGHPVIGDEQYGHRGRGLTDRLARLSPALRAAAGAVARQLLHARRLQFVHPTSGDLLEIEAPLPDDVARLVGAIMKDQ
jgi:23S rRNA pseudouridine1911/1915/1917 synthase